MIHHWWWEDQSTTFSGPIPGMQRTTISTSLNTSFIMLICTTTFILCNKFNPVWFCDMLLLKSPVTSGLTTEQSQCHGNTSHGLTCLYWSWCCTLTSSISCPLYHVARPDKDTGLKIQQQSTTYTIIIISHWPQPSKIYFRKCLSQPWF